MITVRVFQVGGRSRSIVIPLAVADLLNIQPGDEYELDADTHTRVVTLRPSNGNGKASSQP